MGAYERGIQPSGKLGGTGRTEGSSLSAGTVLQRKGHSSKKTIPNHFLFLLYNQFFPLLTHSISMQTSFKKPLPRKYFFNKIKSLSQFPTFRQVPSHFSVLLHNTTSSKELVFISSFTILSGTFSCQPSPHPPVNPSSLSRSPMTSPQPNPTVTSQCSFYYLFSQ